MRIGMVASSTFARRVLVVVMLLSVAACVLRYTPGRSELPAKGVGQGDIALYIAIVAEMRAGHGYYDASGHQLRMRGYPTRSLFNWRPPLLYWLLSSIPQIGLQLLLIGLGVMLLVNVGRLLPREPLAVVPMVNTAIGLIVPVAVYVTEAWAGACIALSALAYAGRKYRYGVFWGLWALFIRETAGAYCLLALCIAAHQRRWREVSLWAVGLAAYGVYFGVHSWSTLQHIRPDDHAHLTSWLYFGGLPFLLQTWQANGLLLVAPPIVLAAVVVAIVAAGWSPDIPLHIRGSVLLYSLLFLVVGQPFNQYWGLLTAPMIGLWLAYAPGGFRRLWKPVDGKRQQPSIVAA